MQFSNSKAREEDPLANDDFGKIKPRDRISNKQLSESIELKSSFTGPSTLTNANVLLLSVACYHRLIGSLFSESPNLSRFLKPLNTVSQCFMVLSLSGIIGLNGSFSMLATVLWVLGIMVVIRAVFHAMIPTSKTESIQVQRTMLCLFVYLASIVLGHAYAILYYHRDSEQSLFKWKGIFLITFLIEFVALDTLIMPLIVLYIVKGLKQRRLLSPIFLN